MGSIENNYNTITERISEAVSRTCYHRNVTLVAVSKTQPASKIRELYNCGARIFGENKVQEALDKIRDLCGVAPDIMTGSEPAVFHLIGRLQTNKVKYAVGEFALIHSVDRSSLLETIDRIAGIKGVNQDILIQINLANEEQKGGVAVGQLDGLVKEAVSAKNITLKGFMFIPPFLDDPEENRPLFRQMNEIYEKYQSLYPQISILSMGMSDDYYIAIEEGANMVRVGTALFGAR